ncbi:MAG: FHA domain-containing protein [Proteobacteria bacterium]|nr:FHA domain-containing protein [Pseudomonadota bacterium]
MSGLKTLVITKVSPEGEETKSFEGFSCLTFGRSPESSWFCESSFMSRAHFRLSVVDQGELCLEDLGSTNGTYLNGRPLEPHKTYPVQAGDKIQTGKAPFTFKIDKYSDHESEAPVETSSPQGNALFFVDEAKKKAAQIIAQSYVEAENAAQSIYDQAQMDRKRLQREAELILKQAQSDSQSILDSAEKLAQEMMDDARKVAAELRERSRAEREQQMALLEKELSLEKSRATAEIQKARDGYKEVLERSFEQEKKMKLQELESRAEFDLKNKLMQIEKENQRTREEAERYAAEKKQAVELELSSLQHKISRLEQDFQQKLSQIDEMSVRERELESKISGLAVSADSLALQIADKEKARDSLNRDCKDKEESLKRLESQFFETGARLQREFAEKQSQYQVNLGRLEQECRDHSARLESLQQNYESRSVELKRAYEAQVHDLKEKYEKMGQAEQQKYESLLALEMKEIQKQKEKLMESLWMTAPALANELVLEAEKLAARYVDPAKISQLSEELRASFENHVRIKISKLMTHQGDQSVKSFRVKQRYPWQPFISGAATMVLVLSVYVGLAYQMDWSVNPVQRALKKETQSRQMDLVARKFNPQKDALLRDTLVESVIYTNGFVERFKDEQFKNSLIKSTMLYMLRTFEVPEEKTIAAISAIQSTVLELENRKEKIHPDFVNKDLAKMKEIELQTKDELKKILGTEVRVEALLQHQREFLKQTLNRQPANQ